MTALVLTLSMMQAGAVVLDNEYVKVTKNGAPCAVAPPSCGARVIVALAEVELAGMGAPRKLKRGDLAVFQAGEAHALPGGGDYLEVAFKPGHPPVKSPPALIPPDKNTLVYDGPEFFVFEEKLDPGDTRPRHSHSQRLVIVLNDTRLQQWPEGEPEVFRAQIPNDVHFNQPVTHVVKTVGAKPLRNIVIELKPSRSLKQ